MGSYKPTTNAPETGSDDDAVVSRTKPMSAKAQELARQLGNGEIVIEFDPEVDEEADK